MAWGLSAAHVDDEGHCAGSHWGNEAPERSRAARMVASLSVDAEECSRVLDMLGLNPAEGLEGGNATQ